MEKPQDYKDILIFYPNFTNILDGIVFFRTKKDVFIPVMEATEAS